MEEQKIMNIFKKFGKLTSYVAILSLLSQMFVGVMPAMAAPIIDNVAPVGGRLMMKTKMYPSGITISEPTAGIYTLPDLSLDGVDQFNSLSIVVSDSNLDTTSVPVTVDGAVNGEMVYSNTDGIWNYANQSSRPNFIAGTHYLTATFSDIFENTTRLTASFKTDTDGPTATVAHNEANKTITYTFSEPVQLRDSSYAIVTPSDYASKLAIYDLTNYEAHVFGTDAPATNGGNIASAVLSPDEKNITITYDGSLIQKTGTTYIVDAWGYNITDLAGNKMLADASTQSFTVIGDSTAPTTSVTHSEINKTITYTFSEPVVLRDALSNILPDSAYTSSLAIYDRETYLAHNLFDPEPAHAAGVNITSAVLSSGGKTMTITYTGSLIKNVDSYYIVDAWGKNITDLVSNKMVQDPSQIFMVAGDKNAPDLTMLGSSPIQVTVGATYTDAGATALDVVDGDLTAKIITASTVDSSKVGSYTVTYTVADSAGNTMSTARIVNVVAAEVPVLVVSTTTTDTGSTTTGGTTPSTDTTTVADPNISTTEVKGASTTDNSDKTTNPGFFMSTWLGIYNWIWLLGAAAAVGGGLWWLFGSIRGRNEE